MQINVYYINQTTGVETFGGACNLDDAMDRDFDADGYHEALDRLQMDGRYWLGGGASPLVLLMKAE